MKMYGPESKCRGMWFIGASGIAVIMPTIVWRDIGVFLKESKDSKCPLSSTYVLASLGSSARSFPN
jgi:hypothetical protein